MEGKGAIFGREIKLNTGKKEMKQQPKNKPRKKRSDAKKDIKFRLSGSDKKKLQFAAMDHGISLTAFASYIVERDLLKDRQYDDYNYNNDGYFIHVKLNQDYFIMLQTLAVDWGISYRRAVHRIIKSYLQSLPGDLLINDWRACN